LQLASVHQQPMNPEVSVIIPTCNRRRMLREAVSSVLAQTHAAGELIIVDDGSTDGTIEDLRCGELARVLSAAPSTCRIVIERTPQRGPGAARNRGAALATAEYVAFLDSDDLWAPDKLRRQLAYMRMHPEYPLAQTQELWMRDGRRVNSGQRHQKRAGNIFEPSLHLCLIRCSATMMRAALFREMGGFDEKMRACEDYDLWLRILARYRVGLLDELLVTRRAGHPDQLSARPALDRFRIRALIKLLAGCELPPELEKAVAEVLAEKCAIYGSGLKRRGRMGEAEIFAGPGHRARLWLESGVKPLAGYWRNILETLPIGADAA
jgi:glycosyltransferase involved in cell wall biosynthesis